MAPRSSITEQHTVGQRLCLASEEEARVSAPPSSSPQPAFPALAKFSSAPPSPSSQPEQVGALLPDRH
eukprot:37432-Rhodomonas_salina.1